MQSNSSSCININFVIYYWMCHFLLAFQSMKRWKMFIGLHWETEFFLFSSSIYSLSISTDDSCESAKFLKGGLNVIFMKKHQFFLLYPCFAWNRQISVVHKGDGMVNLKVRTKRFLWRCIPTWSPRPVFWQNKICAALPQNRKILGPSFPHPSKKSFLMVSHLLVCFLSSGSGSLAAMAVFESRYKKDMGVSLFVNTSKTSPKSFQYQLA